MFFGLFFEFLPFFVNGKNGKFQRREFSNLEKAWQVEVNKAFERNLKTLKVREYDLRLTDLHPYLSVMEPEIYVNAIIKEAKNLAKSTETFSPPISYLSKQLALSLFRKYEVQN